VHPRFPRSLAGLTDETSPLGSDDGADVKQVYEEWREDGRSDKDFLGEFLRADGISPTGLDNLAEEQQHERLAKDEWEPIRYDAVVIAFAFCQLYYEGAVRAADRDRALRAIKRQTWPAMMAARGWSDPGYRLEMLDRMEKALLAAAERNDPVAPAS
jgi:uncharacterized protein YfeS